MLISMGSFFVSLLSEVKRQKSVPEDLKKADEDGDSTTEFDLHRPFEEEVCLFKITSKAKN